ncbi:hypothetical protein HPHPP4D_1387 [Helicobacter pylori Hp P-4d]|uniref:Uncharacterized protein n=1 Tax=Helicobacter pylori Hp P-4 TaxID=992075 RepID=J0PTR3_HELPX|nr:hypothetical protein HPHPP4_1177 [Helicobacter pylori Hp P-4]EJC22294.1 hypothetical protein HPHPP4D_1387 [Helicobacter pylori Hp P-4d]EJC23008.1 hypothetical protein HPHPP4C_1200 [Helicobacter pylori Hp P-4c]
MDTTRFIRNFVLFKEALQKQNFNNKELNTTSMQAALQSEQLSFKSRSARSTERAGESKNAD